MIATMYELGVFAVYQLTVALGILLMPVALLAQRVGVTLPVGRVVERVGRAYEQTTAE